MTSRSRWRSRKEPEPKYKTDSHSVEGIEVGSVACEFLRSVDYDSRMDEAIKELLKKDVSSLIVMRNNRTVGILTVKDIFKAALQNKEEGVIPIEISELDLSTKEYEQEIVDSISKVAGKVAKFKEFRIEDRAERKEQQEHVRAEGKAGLRHWQGARGEFKRFHA